MTNAQAQKANLLIQEVEKYAKTWEQVIELKWEVLNLVYSGKEINLATITEIGSIELHDAYMDCKSYPELFPTVSTQEVKEGEETQIVNWLFWSKNSNIRSTYHAVIYVGQFQYGLTIFKENNRWLIMGEDHDVTDYEENLDWEGKVVGFKTLREAKEKAEDIREWMQECGEEAWV